MGEFVLKTRIFMGKDGLDKILQGVSRAFIVTDRFMHESGKVSYLTEPLEARNIEYQIFSEVKPDPDIATVTKGIGKMLEFQPQVLFALGGGSPIDAAKAMNWLSVQGGLDKEKDLCSHSYNQRHWFRSQPFFRYQRSGAVCEVSVGIR